MIATPTFVQQKFDEYNRLMFQGKLPPIPIQMSRARTYLGQCVSKRRQGIFGKSRLYDFRLRISTAFDLPQQEIEDTIIHEMIHYYIGVNNLRDSSAHGPLFRQMMEHINTTYHRNITISHRSTPEQKQASERQASAHWHVVAVVHFTDGRRGIKVLPRIHQRIQDYHAALSSSPSVSKIEYFMTFDIFFNRYPNSAAYRVYDISPEDLDTYIYSLLRSGNTKVITSGTLQITQVWK